MPAPNPSPDHISKAAWEFWLRFDALEDSARLGGILALKPGYHSYATRLPRTDYSIADVAADRAGPRQFSSAIDLTMSNSAMVKYSKRLDAAARARDERLFINGTPIIREFIGTLDNRRVYCFVLTGGRSLGVGADSGPDWDRDNTHLWHVHISIIRRYAADPAAYERLYSVLSNESLDSWRKRHGTMPAAAKPASTPAKPASAPAKPAAAGRSASHAPGSRELSWKAGTAPLTGEDVKFVQRFIGPKRMGQPDGVTGAAFVSGLKWYQAMRGLKVDAIVGKATWAAMGVKTTY